MRSRTGQPSELALIHEIRARARQAANRRRVTAKGMKLGIGDDCALLRIGADEELAITTDLSIDGRHFRLDWHPPECVGHRVLARGLSDLAAMGARPVAAFLSLGLPRALVTDFSVRSSKTKGKDRTTWTDRFLDGFFALATEFKTPLAGGDLAESPIALADIVLTGAVRRGKALLRSGARPGDLLYVTGTLGGAAAALAKLAQWAESEGPGKEGSAPSPIPAKLQRVLAPHLFPTPRIAQGAWLARNGAATAAIDLSDGLSTDLAHLCEESHIGAEIDAAALPVHPGATLDQALHGGEDYELLFAAPPDVRIPRRIAGVPVSRIGRMVRARKGRPPVVLITAKGEQALAAQGWEHFSQKSGN
ncbi:MAG: thiamine-phosphate kinase [Terracidiphilus sp.]